MGIYNKQNIFKRIISIFRPPFFIHTQSLLFGPGAILLNDF